jgi:hypothetical protein
MKDNTSINTEHLITELARAKHLLSLIGSLAHSVRWGHMGGDSAVKFLTEWYDQLKPYYHESFDAITVRPPHTASNASTSPDTHMRLLLAYQQDCQQRGKAVDPKVIKYYEDIKHYDLNWASTVNTRHDLEWDLRTTEWILQKVRDSQTYAQSLYAALCNNLFKKLYMNNEQSSWHCSWRHSGSIIANMRQQGDYMDWYCSGIIDGDTESIATVPEGTVTDEISQDLIKLGWHVVSEVHTDNIGQVNNE